MTYSMRYAELSNYYVVDIKHIYLMLYEICLCVHNHLTQNKQAMPAWPFKTFDNIYMILTDFLMGFPGHKM